MRLNGRLGRTMGAFLPVLAVCGCIEGATDAPARVADCRTTYVEEELPGDAELFDARFVVASQSDDQVTGTLYIQRHEITSFGTRPRIRGQAPVVLSIRTVIEDGKKIASGSGTIGAFVGISGQDKSYTDFMWRVPGSTRIGKVFVEEDRIILADLGPNFLARDSDPNLFLRRSC